MTEEQKNIIAENTLFYNYIQAVYYCFNGNSLDEALEYANAVLDSQENLSQALYLQGTIYYNMKNFEEAIISYKASLQVEQNSPNVWYALANAYDALEQYEEAYEACLQVNKLLPNTDHEFDFYGVGIHNNWLMDSLEKKLGGN